MPFTSETAKIARAKLQQPAFDRKGWARRWAAQERARRKAVGVCVRCGDGLVQRFLTCVACRVRGRRA